MSSQVIYFIHEPTGKLYCNNMHDLRRAFTRLKTQYHDPVKDHYALQVGKSWGGVNLDECYIVDDPYVFQYTMEIYNKRACNKQFKAQGYVLLNPYLGPRISVRSLYGPNKIVAHAK